MNYHLTDQQIKDGMKIIFVNNSYVHSLLDTEIERRIKNFQDKIKV